MYRVVATPSEPTLQASFNSISFCTNKIKIIFLLLLIPSLWPLINYIFFEKPHNFTKSNENAAEQTKKKKKNWGQQKNYKHKMTNDLLFSYVVLHNTTDRK